MVTTTKEPTEKYITTLAKTSSSITWITDET